MVTYISLASTALNMAITIAYKGVWCIVHKHSVENFKEPDIETQVNSIQLSKIPTHGPVGPHSNQGGATSTTGPTALVSAGNGQIVFVNKNGQVATGKKGPYFNVTSRQDIPPGKYYITSKPNGEVGEEIYLGAFKFINPNVSTSSSTRAGAAEMMFSTNYV